jgi:hypothetical protein
MPALLRQARHGAAGLALLALPACVAAPMPPPGTPEFAAAQASRGYDCGLSVERGRILARLERGERARFLAASSSFAVKSYRLPRPCGPGERAAVQHELTRLVRR